MAPSLPVQKTGLVKGSQTQLTGLALQTGTGASQSIAHSLAYTPTRVIISKVTEPAAGNAAYALGTHDATNVQVSAYSDMTFYAFAF